ncbi:two-component sensor histidine kinase [Burkholderia multivorans]|uniref:ATP-binding protein n=1 Tax=Burkholderia multivorans TaxID=87883 RepID=UPI000D002723|nr:ATP-binding protein [Burkholderia multivorans]PRG77689.1 two-component sensor histidine kinase [Burkholderia multivorans]
MISAAKFFNRVGRAPGLTAKLFIAMAVVNILLIGAMSLGARISFQRGFLGYLKEQDVKRLDASTAPLAAAYREHGSWAFLYHNRHLWHELLVRSHASSPAPGNGGSPAPPPVADLVGASLRFSLLDTSGHYLAGNPDIVQGSPRRPIVVDGKTVGWLTIVPVQQVTEAGDLLLQREQREATWIIAVVATLGAVLISLWVARTLGMPLQRIARATHVLAAGNFKARVPQLSAGELGQLEADFNNLAITLERNERMRAALVADVSHELRTPLAVMRGEVEALELGIREMSVDAMRSLSSELERLHRLVDDLYHLSLSDVGALQYHFGDVDLVEALEEVLMSVKQPLAAANITLHTEFVGPDLRLHGDERRLQQVFSNIFQNVLRYVPAGGHVEIRIKREGARIRIDVLDTGPGVPPDALEAIFGRFYRVDASRSRATGGAGLGLPICRSIVEAHKGHISAANAPQGGLWISIMLPARKDES